MMVSPEGYYEMNLKGKSPSQIITCIRGLKKEIGHCKNVLENPDDFSEKNSMFPRPDTRLWCTRLYLDRAIQALKDMGVDYTPTKKEITIEQFENDLKHLYRFSFNIGGFFGGYQTYTVTLKDDDSIGYYVEHSLMPEPSNLETAEAPFSKEEFLEMLDDLHLGEWKRKYDNSYVLDGTQWELTLEFSNGRRKVCFYGSNKYPWCFDKLTEFFGCYDDDEE